MDNRAGWVEIGEGEEMVAVLGHLDTVPLGGRLDASGIGSHGGKWQNLWKGNPGMTRGPTIGAIYALKAIQDLEIPLDRRIRVIFGTDEESGCSCIHHYVDSGEEIPVMGFTPDGSYPLIFFEKGMTTLRIGKEHVEEGDKKILRFEGGTAANIVTQECVLEVEGDLEVEEAEGVTAEKKDGITRVLAKGEKLSWKQAGKRHQCSDPSVKGCHRATTSEGISSI